MPPEKNHRRGGNCHRLNERPPRKGFGWASGFDLCLHQPISATPGRARSSFGGLSEPLVQPLWHLWRQHKPILISGNFIVCFPPPPKNISQSFLHIQPCSLVTYQPERKAQKDDDSCGLWSVLECHYFIVFFCLPFACETTCLQSFAIWIAVPLYYVQFVPQV